MNLFKRLKLSKKNRQSLKSDDASQTTTESKNKISISDVAHFHKLGPQALAKAEPTLIDPSVMISKNFKTPKMDRFCPKRDHRLERCMGEIQGDQDIWVERFYMTEKGRRIYYFRSLQTKRCVFMEPPTGSSMVVYWDELEHYPSLREFATEPLEKPIEQIMEKPDYRGPRYKKRLQKVPICPQAPQTVLQVAKTEELSEEFEV